MLSWNRWFSSPFSAALLIAAIAGSFATLFTQRPARADIYVITRDTDLKSLGLADQQLFTVVTRHTDLRAREIARLTKRLEQQAQADQARRIDLQMEAVRLEMANWEKAAETYYSYNRHYVDPKPFAGYEADARLNVSLAKLRLTDLEAERRQVSDQRDIRRLRELTSPTTR